MMLHWQVYFKGLVTLSNQHVYHIGFKIQQDNCRIVRLLHLHWKTVWLQMIISLIIPLHKIVTKANMATDVDGNILEMSFLFTKRSFPN